MSRLIIDNALTRLLLLFGLAGQKWDLMFLTQSLDQFLVSRLIAVLRQDAKQGSSLVKSFGGLMGALGESPSCIKVGLSTSRTAVSRSICPPRSSVAPPTAAGLQCKFLMGFNWVTALEVDLKMSKKIVKSKLLGKNVNKL